MTAGMAVLAGTLGVFTAGAVIVCNEGAVRVEVREKSNDGKHIHLILPAAIAPVAAFVIPRANSTTLATKSGHGFQPSGRPA